MSNMVEEGGDIEQYFQQVKIDKLPEGRKPKYCIGDLVEISFRSDDGPASYKLRGDYGLVCEVLFYCCTDFDKKSKHSDPHYIIEYKLLISKDRRQYRYISEENLKKVNE